MTARGSSIHSSTGARLESQGIRRRVALLVVALFVFSIPAEDALLVGGVGASRLLGLLALAATVGALVDRGSLRLRPPSLLLLVGGLYFSWSAATYFWSVAPSASLVRIVSYAQLVGFVWLVHENTRKDQGRRLLMQAFVLGCYVAIAIAAYATFGTSEPGFRDVGPFGANSFASTVALAMPMAWSLYLRGSSQPLHVLNLLYPAISMFALVLAASRGGLFTGLLALMVIPVTLSRLTAKKRFALAVGIVATVWMLFVFAPQWFPNLQPNVERLATTGNELETGTLTGRTVIWTAGLEVLIASPVAGVGAGAFGYAVEDHLGAFASAHNTFLSVAVDSGLIGLFLFLLLLATALASALAASRHRAISLILFASLLVAMLPSTAEAEKATWFILALLAAARPIVLTNAEAEAAGRTARSGPEHEWGA